jgi:uncharacterized protein (DUF4415 family)
MTAKSKNTKVAWVDPDDAPELTDAFFAKATPRIGDNVVSRAEYAAAARKRGRPAGSTKTDAKQAVKLRLDPDVLTVLRATGPGWQTRINTILRERFAL